MGRIPIEIVLDEDRKQTLEQWRRRGNTKASLHVRAGIILDCARGDKSQEVAQRYQVSRQTMSKWRARFARLGLSGLCDAPRPGPARSAAQT